MNTEAYLKIGPGRRILQTRDGKPFFWVGDTAWACPARASWDEWVKYIDIRAEQGFNVIQINSLPQFDSAKPICKERTPFALDADEQFNYEQIHSDYFDHLDRMIEYANKKGLIVAVIVLWFVHVPNSRPDQAKHCTSRMTLKQAQEYAEMLVKRLESRDVVWMISGDDDFKGEGVKEFYNAVAKTVKGADGNKRLVTTHPAFTSGAFFHNEDWLDFNMIQSSHGDATQHHAYEFVANEWVREPAKPVINAEPCYEGVNGWHTGHVFDRKDVRKACWWSILAGSIAGVTYGASGVWQWITAHEDNKNPNDKAKRAWYEAVLLPGAKDIVRIKEFLTGFPWWTLEPAQELIVSQQDVHVSAAASRDGKLLMVYLPEGGEITVDTSGMQTELSAYYWNPSNGDQHEANTPIKGIMSIKAPSDEDWMYILKGKKRLFI